MGSTHRSQTPTLTHPQTQQTRRSERVNNQTNGFKIRIASYLDKHLNTQRVDEQRTRPPRQEIGIPNVQSQRDTDEECGYDHNHLIRLLFIKYRTGSKIYKQNMCSKVGLKIDL